jgi:hypothetical protein
MQVMLLLAKITLSNNYIVCNNYIACFKIKELQENSDRKI